MAARDENFNAQQVGRLRFGASVYLERGHRKSHFIQTKLIHFYPLSFDSTHEHADDITGVFHCPQEKRLAIKTPTVVFVVLVKGFLQAKSDFKILMETSQVF